METKELAILCVMSLNIINQVTFGFYFPYFCSYYMAFNSSISFSKMFWGIFPLNCGIFGGSILTEILLRKFQLRQLIMIGGLAYFISATSLSWGTSLWGWFAGMTFCGLANQLCMIPITIFVNSKSGEKANVNISIFMTATGIGTLLWGAFLALYVNPQNKRMVPSQVTSDLVYELSVARRIIHYSFLNGLAAFVTGCAAFVIIKDPPPNERKKSTFHESLLDFSDTNSLNTKSFISKSFRSQANFIIHTRDFILIVAVTVIRNSPIFYFNNNGKIIGMLVKDNDKAINMVFTLTIFLNIAGRLLGGAIWNVLGFFRSYLIVYVINLIIDLGFFLGPRSFFIYTTLITLQRFNNGLIVVFNQIAVFSLFKPDRALYILKYYDVSFVMSVALTTLLNSIFGNTSYRSVSFLYSITDITGLIVLYLFLKNYRPFK